MRLVAKSVWENPGNRGKRIRKSIEAVLWQLQKHLLGTRRLLTLPNGVRFMAYPDCVVSSGLIYSDWPEYHELMFARSVLQPNEVVIDVGANVGHFSLLLADIVGPENILAFEPTPVSFERLEENWKLNGWETQNLFEVAVGKEEGLVSVEDVDHPKTTVSVSDESAESSVDVRLLPLDDLRQRWQGAEVGFVKVDVEGYEAEVFRGADTLLRRDRPRLTMFESLEEGVNDNIRQFLEERSYVIFQLDDEGNPDPNRYSKQNLFAVPEEIKNQVVKGIDDSQ